MLLTKEITRGTKGLTKNPSDISVEMMYNSYERYIGLTWLYVYLYIVNLWKWVNHDVMDLQTPHEHCFHSIGYNYSTGEQLQHNTGVHCIWLTEFLTLEVTMTNWESEEWNPDLWITPQVFPWTYGNEVLQEYVTKRWEDFHTCSRFAV